MQNFDTLRRGWFLSPDGDGGSNADPNAGGDGGTTPPAGGDKTYTKADLDAEVSKAIEARMAREAKAREKAVSDAIEARLAEELKKREMSEAERLKVEKDEADKRAATATASANAKLLRAEAKGVALSAGVDPKFVDDVITLAKVEGESYFTDGDPDPAKITTSINAVLADRPFYKGGAGGQDFGRDLGGGHGTQVTLAGLQQQYAEAEKVKDVTRMMSLKNQMFDLQHKGA